MRYSALRMLSGDGSLGPGALTYKIYWATWRRKLGELAMDVLGRRRSRGSGEHELSTLTKMYLFSRADTIYGGTNQIQRNLIAERALDCRKSREELCDDDVRTTIRTTGRTVRRAAVSARPQSPRGENRACHRGGRHRHRIRDGAPLHGGGARVFVSDAHERRLGESAARLTAPGGAPVPSRVCDVTKQSDVSALIESAIERWAISMCS